MEAANSSSSLRRSSRKRKINSLFSDSQMSLEEQRVRKAATSVFKETKNQCQSLLNELRAHKYALLFNQPVDPVLDGVPDYFDKILNPMDFQTVQNQLDASVYSTSSEFAEDIRLIFTNCYTYHPVNSELVRQAKVLSAVFEKGYRPIYEREKILIEQNHMQEMQSIINELQSEHQKLLNELNRLKKIENGAATSPPQSTAPKSAHPVEKKPKRKYTRKSQTTEQAGNHPPFGILLQKRLSKKISKLPLEDLEKLVAIVSRDAVDSGDKEIEIDLGKLRNSTLWELDGFVDSCLKSRNITISDSSSSDSESSSNSSGTESEKENIQIVDESTENKQPEEQFSPLDYPTELQKEQ